MNPISLKDRDLRREGLLVTEGRTLTRRLIDSPLEILEVVCSQSLVSEWEPIVAGRSPLRVLSDQEMAELAGFPFHRGVLALARRPQILTVTQLLETYPTFRRLVGAIDLTDPENLGSLGRSTWSLGWDALILGPRTCDPFSRLSLKVSMGAFLYRPLALAQDSSDLEILKSHDFLTAATILGTTADDLKSFSSPDKLFLAFGNEASGLDQSWIQSSQVLLTIPMAAQADSLNVGVAAGIFLYKLGLP